MELKAFAGSAEILLQLVDGFDLEKLVLRSPVSLNRNIDFAGVYVFQWWAAIPDDGCVYFR